MNANELHEPINLGNPTEFTIKELAAEVIAVCGSKSNLSYLPLPEDDPRQRKPNIERAQASLGWNPTIPLRQGLEKTVAYFSSRLSQ
jgi:UDP-glucuronate decarboxylase